MKIITTHKGSDFDALASLVGANLIYPDAKPVLPSSVNENLKGFLSIHKDLFKLCDPKEIDLDRVETLIVVDTHVWSRLDQRLMPLSEKEDLEIIVWDHHLKGDMTAKEAHVRETGATITMLIQEMKRTSKLITPIQATLFLMGLYEDTGSLSFPSTLAQDAYAAGFLLEREADLNILSTFLKPAYGEKQKDILFEMVKQAERTEIKGFSFSLAEMEITGRVQNLAMVVQMYREIVNVDVAFGIFRDTKKDKCMVIGRSGIDEVDIGFMMRSMGGGGHPGAGSALLKSVHTATVKHMILELLKGNQYASVMVSDIMSFPVIKVLDTTLIEEAAMLLRDVGCTGVPVVDDGDKLVGVISRRDFKKVRKDKQMKSPVKSIMSRTIITISHDKSAIEAARLMIKHDIGRLPVMEDGNIIGIVTRSDAMLYFYDLLPD